MTDLVQVIQPPHDETAAERRKDSYMPGTSFGLANPVMDAVYSLYIESGFIPKAHDVKVWLKENYSLTGEDSGDQVSWARRILTDLGYIELIVCPHSHPRWRLTDLGVQHAKAMIRINDAKTRYRAINSRRSTDDNSDDE